MVANKETINYLIMISNPKNGKAFFKCKCGNVKEICVKDVKAGKTRSCGCLQRECTSERFYKHGGSGTRLCRIWRAMKTRCYNPNTKDAKNYIERGIEVCDEWKDDFTAFQRWALKNGYEDGLTIDRKNVDKGYSPENCRWVNCKEQSRNKRNNIIVNGVCLTEYCETHSLPYATIAARIRSGWSIDDAISKPVKGVSGHG